MRYLSLFSGIEAATVAWEPLGWEAAAFCEVDEFPSAVLAHRWPDVPNLGDIAKVDWSDFNERYGAVDVIVGGSPCQSFSVAGGRESLDGQSRLMFEYLRAVEEVRPRIVVWENVPGVLNTKDNAFGQLLGTLGELGYRDLAYRVLDAQFFRVAQRRRRVFVVGHLGEGFRSAAVLFEPDGLRWDHPSSREKRESLTRAAKQRAAEGGCDCLTPWDTQTARIYGSDGVWPTLSANSDKSGLNRQAVLVSQPCYTIAGNIIGRDDKNGGHQLGVVDANDNGAFTLNTADRHAVLAIVCMADDNANAAIDFDMCGSLKVGGSAPAVTDGYTVRRLTPRECERLQGFPDDHTLIPYRGKKAEECPDTPRYKALGNSMAVPVMAWIGRRLEAIGV